VELINRYRPKTFEEVVGHDAVVEALATALDNGTARTFLLMGPSGVGKTTLARVCAASLGEHELVEVDAATYTGIEDMRKLAADFAYRPLGGGVRAVIIDEFHALSKPAITSWLKSLEEPQPWNYYFLCTTDAAKVPDAVRTRCYRVDLKPVPVKAITALLTNVARLEKWKLPAGVAQLCAEEATGSPRQALSYLAACASATTLAEAEDLVLNAPAEEMAEAVDLARALVQRKRWKEVQGVLAKLQGASPESVRHVVRAYVNKVAVGARDEKTAGLSIEILDAFGQPFYQPADLTVAVGKVLLS